MLKGPTKLAAVVFLAANLTASAQIMPKAFTLKAHPITESRSFLLTEFYVNRQFEHYSNSRKGGWELGAVVGWELGYMRNINERWAVGASAFFNGSDDRSQFGIKPRARYWLGKNSSLDFAVGPILVTIDDNSYSNMGVASHIGVNANSWLAFTIGMEYSHLRGGGYPYVWPGEIPASVDRVTISGGARIGAVPGIVVGTVGPLLITALIYVLLHPVEAVY